ncbi:hypothetical protein HanRHA438_Chr04g0188571 [Helianthus annuus]|nr:hypothetical protein HanHA300_Chr04g0146401 [Helianthus annuus]KAJ0597889.1 hypothetical protein HanHA89_Chr04g0159771 [Helianthus annuus]KAJ0927940.1 hypothetical protein HanRHA438_Chr04g0188571 [Helianthus annuus]
MEAWARSGSNGSGTRKKEHNRMQGAISDLDDCFAIEYVIIKARYKSGLIVNPGQVRINEIIF